MILKPHVPPRFELVRAGNGHTLRGPEGEQMICTGTRRPMFEHLSTISFPKPPEFVTIDGRSVPLTADEQDAFRIRIETGESAVYLAGKALA